jgi:hypothetical protein
MSLQFKKGIKEVLYEFEGLSGLKANPTKSFFFFSFFLFLCWCFSRRKKVYVGAFADE